MRKLTTTVLFALLVTTSAFAAAPRNESKDTPGPVTRVVEKIKSIIVHILDEPVISVPTPFTNQ